MPFRAVSIVALALLAPAVVAAPAQKGRLNAGDKLIQSCDAHKFETVVDVMGDGQPRQSKVKLCGVEGQSDAEWIDTLRDAVRKLEANKDMPAAQREQIVSAIKSEIARLSILTAGPALPRRNRAAVGAPAQPLSRDYATLPPLPVARDGESAAIPEEGSATTMLDSPTAQVGAPPVKDGPSAPPIAVKNSPGTAVAPPLAAGVMAPRLKFGCDTPGDLSSDAPCAEFARDTTITIHASEDVAPGMMLQFVRNNQPRADVPLDGLRRGGELRVALPAKVCSGFTSGKLELRIVAANSPYPLSSDGPYSLRC